MFSLESIPLSRSLSIIEAIVNRVPEGRARLATEYGHRLSMLIQRHCCERAAAFSAAIFDETMIEVQNLQIASDEELPKLIRSIFRRLLPEFEQDIRARSLEKIRSGHRQHIRDILHELKIIRSAQLEALIRFYVDDESEAFVCADLGLSQGEFQDAKKVLREIVHHTLTARRVRVKLQSKIVKAVFRARATAT